MNLDAIRAVANAVLYEGYMLYPYRPSALKNRSQGWSFGTLLPPSYVAENPGESDLMQGDVLLLASGDSIVDVEARFLQAAQNGAETLERTVHSALPISAAGPGIETNFAFGDEDHSGVRGVLEIQTRRLDTLFKLTVRFRNRTESDQKLLNRDHAIKRGLIAAHALITIQNGRFVSLIDPPEQFRTAVSSCKQIGVFPVMVGDETEQNAMLLSPIILYDYPKVASESKGDFFDSTEIDEMLSLRVLTLSDTEKEEIRAAGGRVSQLLERTEAL